MKHRISRSAVLAVAAAAIFLAGTRSQGQAPALDDPATRQLAAEVLQQHRLMVENQTRIEEKMAQLAENIRLARIYSARSGKGGAQ